MNDIEKKELLVKSIEELDEINKVKLIENQNIIDGNRKLHEVSEQMACANKTIKDELEILEPILQNKEGANDLWDKRIEDKKKKYAEENKKLNDLRLKIDEVNDAINKAEKNLEKVNGEIKNKESEKFIVGRLREVLEGMFEQFKPIHEKAGVEWPYPGGVDDVLDGLLKK